jgi:hypothetical protein
MMHTVLEHLVKPVPEQVRSRAFRMVLTFILQLLQNQWQVPVPLSLQMKKSLII